MTALLAAFETAQMTAFGTALLAACALYLGKIPQANHKVLAGHYTK